MVRKYLCMPDSQRSEWLHSAPALIALALGVIYGTGALSIYGQLKAEGLNGVQAMALVPLEQILGRGIGYMTREFGQALVTVGVIVLAFGPGGGITPAQSESEIRTSRFMAGLIAVFLGAILISSPIREGLVYLISISLSAFASLHLWRASRARGESGVRQVLVVFGLVYLTFAISTTIGSAFLTPRPLPQVVLASSASPEAEIEGGLVADSGGTWYVAEQDDESVIAVNGRFVEQATFTYPSRKPEQSLLDWILGRPPSDLLGRSREP